jgi:hypothetical protein
MKIVDLKIATEEVDGVRVINPETMSLLMEFGGHRQVCDQCEKCFKDHIGVYCITGKMLLEQIMERPDVQIIEK